MRAWSVESTFFVNAVADHLGMGTTDFSCLTVLLLEGPLTAGALAERSGLTTGAVTGLVDRLERGGWVRRLADPGDRRRVIVEPVLARAGELRPLLDPMLRSDGELHERLAPRDLEVIERFVREATSILERQVERLRVPAPLADESAAAGGPLCVPMPAGVPGQRAGLHLLGLASRVTVRTLSLGGDLCRVDFGSRPPHVKVRGSDVFLAGGRGRWLSSRGSGSVDLDAGVAWDLDVRGGASHVDADLSAGQVHSVTVSGGALALTLRLPAPEGSVAIRVSGGASSLSISRPAGVPVSVRVRGGVGRVRVDGRQLEPAALWSGASGGAGSGRYELDLRGGANKVVVEEH